MSNVQFETDQFQEQYKSHSVMGQPQIPAMANWLMKKGIIKNESTAGFFLTSIVIINFTLTALLIYYFFIK